MNETTTAKLTVAWIGTGAMGAPMARRVLDAGYPLAVFDRDPTACAELVAAGARLASSPADALKGAQVAFTMLGFPEEVEEVYLAKDGLVGAAEPGTYLVDLSTSDPNLAHDIAEVAEVSELHAFDAPVAGSVADAKAGLLTAFCGATDEAIAPVLPLIQTFADRAVAFGAAGKGQTAKLASQVALAANLVGMAEALSFAGQGGVDASLLLDAMGDGVSSSAVLDVLAPKAAAGDYTAGLQVGHFVKDLGLILAGAEELELTLPGVDTANELFGILNEIGGARMGVQSLGLVYADEATCAAHGLDWSVLAKDEDDEAEGFVGADHGEGCACGCHDHDCDCEDCDGDCDCDEHGHAHGDGREGFSPDFSQN
jgi:3-hydroxyisobutyrate dehydrogenase